LISPEFRNVRRKADSSCQVRFISHLDKNLATIGRSLDNDALECRLCVYSGENTFTEHPFHLQFVSKDASFPMDPVKTGEKNEMILSFVVYPRKITAQCLPYLKRPRVLKDEPEAEKNQKRSKHDSIRSLYAKPSTHPGFFYPLRTALTRWFLI